ncbi:hypothetical protein AA15973_0771 [Komagataeibacter sucrofermentans DSM 15973]|nr:hypothetical protein AA15973_0771 [Komagataeibacter sucrofermentans DSM 15973]
MRTACNQPPGNGQADPAGRSRYNGRAACQINLHGRSSFLCGRGTPMPLGFRDPYKTMDGWQGPEERVPLTPCNDMTALFYAAPGVFFVIT